jgi:hypothetical protein
LDPLTTSQSLPYPHQLVCMQRRDLAFLPCSFLHHCRKNRETILCIQRQVKIICVYPSDLLETASTECQSDFKSNMNRKTNGRWRKITISSPGRAQSIRSFRSITSLYLGSRPAGTIPGLS